MALPMLTPLPVETNIYLPPMNPLVFILLGYIPIPPLPPLGTHPKVKLTCKPPPCRLRAWHISCPMCQFGLCRPPQGWLWAAYLMVFTKLLCGPVFCQEFPLKVKKHDKESQKQSNKRHITWIIVITLQSFLTKFNPYPTSNPGTAEIWLRDSQRVPCVATLLYHCHRDYYGPFRVRRT